MCGIVGTLAFGGRIAGWQEQIRGAMDLMARRGPDD
jgi:asparagine synthetase B (glutamine-hydrolysing)